MNPEVGMGSLIRMIHFNQDIAENRNIFVKSRKFNFIEVYQKGGWKTLPRKDIYQNLIASKKDLMDEYFNKFVENNELRPKHIFNYETFSACLDKYIFFLAFPNQSTTNLKKAKLVYERISKMITLLFLNNQKIEITFKPEQSINIVNNNDDGNKEDIKDKIKNILDKSEEELDDLIESNNDLISESISSYSEEFEESDETECSKMYESSSEEIIGDIENLSDNEFNIPIIEEPEIIVHRKKRSLR